MQLKHLQAETTLTAEPLADGIELVSLLVSSPTKARWKCAARSGCSRQADERQERRLWAAARRGAADGSALKIFATAKNEIGTYIEYRIGHDSFKKGPAMPGAGNEEARVLRMTASPRGRIAIAALVAVVAFGGGVRRGQGERRAST